MNNAVERVLAMLDGFRMSDEMTYSAYSALYDEISLLDDLLKKQEQRINFLEERLRLLEYGDQGTLQSGLMPAT